LVIANCRLQPADCRPLTTARRRHTTTEEAQLVQPLLAFIRRLLSFIGSAIGLAFLLLLLSPVIGPPLYVEIAGGTTRGELAAKREKIDILSNTWTRRAFVDVRFRAAGEDEPEVVEVAVDLATYDQLHVGEAVQVRYAPNATLRQIPSLTIARLASQLPFASLVARIGNYLLGVLLGIAIWLALLWAWSKWRHWSLSVAILGLMAGSVLYLGTGWPSPQPAGALLAGSAQIRGTHEVTQIWEGRRSAGEDAVQPYTIVQLEFVPQGAVDPVVAVDLVDAGSVPALEKGAAVPISYSASEPRWARIDGATRTYYWKNLRSFGLIALIVVPLLLFGWWAARRRARRRAAAPTP
jgi:hypothetical protein